MRRRKRFKSDEETATSCLNRRFEQFLIARDHYGGLSSPLQSFSAQGAKEFQRMLAMAVDDVVDKEDPTVLKRINILQDFFDRPKSVSPASGSAHGTKLTIKGTSASGFEGARKQVKLGFQQIAPGDAVAFHVEECAVLISRF